MPMPQPPSGPAASGAPAAKDVATDDAHAGPASNNGAAAKNGAAAADGSTSWPDADDSVDGASQATPATGLAAMNGHGEINGHAEQQAGQAQRQARKWTDTVSAALSSALTAAEGAVLRNKLASGLVAAGLVMRVLVEAAYHPAIVYIDSLKYLYGTWPGSDPVLYKVPLKMILALGGNLNTVEAVQHLLGIGIAITIYALLVRRGTPRWLAALAMAPVLFDAYQLQAEAMIMPDVWFEAAIVAGLAILLWQKRPTVPTIIIGAAVLGGSTGIHQVGEVMIVPALVCVIVLGGGLQKLVVRVTAVLCSFVLAIALYVGASAALTHHLLISYSGSSLTYGRMAGAVNCSTLNVAPIIKLLCPTKWQQAQGPDWLEHSGQGPLRTYADKLPITLLPERASFVSQFNHAVEKQQTGRVIGAMVRDAVKLFALTRDTSPGDTPIWRWQFHGYFPVFGQYVSVNPIDNKLYIKLPKQAPTPINRAHGGGGGQARVDVPIARFLRSYQIHGGYTPGPLLLLSVLAGLAGSVLLAFRRRVTGVARDLGIACITLFSAVLAVLAVSDAFEFSWRYQLPAIVVLPAVGALGIAMIMALVRKRREPAAAQTVSERAPEPAPAQ